MKDLINLYGEVRVAQIRGFRRAKVTEAMRSLRDVQIVSKGRPAIISLTESLCQRISHFFLLLMPPAPKNSMCKYYGHVVDNKNWPMGQLPRCSDCGVKISGTQNLRKAIAC